MKKYIWLFALLFSSLVNAVDCGYTIKGEKVNIKGQDYWINSTSVLLINTPSGTVNLSSYEALVCLKNISIIAEDIDITGIDRFENLTSVSFKVSNPDRFNLGVEYISRIKNLDSLSFVSPGYIDFSRLGSFLKIKKLFLNVNVEDYSFLKNIKEISELELPAKGINYEFLSEYKQIKTLQLHATGDVYGRSVDGGLNTLNLAKAVKNVHIDDRSVDLSDLKGNRHIEELLIDEKDKVDRSLIESMGSLKKLGVSINYGYGGIKWYEGSEIDTYLTLQESLLDSNVVKGVVTSIDLGAGYINEKHQLIYADKVSLSEPNKCGSNHVYISRKLLGIEMHEYKKLLTTIGNRGYHKKVTKFNLSGCAGRGALIKSVVL